MNQLDSRLRPFLRDHVLDEAMCPDEDVPELTVRAIFISDLHLGCRFSNARALHQFLKRYEPQYLYLVGDIFDGWKLKRGWYWNDSYSFLVRKVIGLLKHGVIIRYCPGNHDEFLRNFLYEFGSVEIADEFVHVTADGKRCLVLHGDQFDVVVRHHHWLTLLGDVGYTALLNINRWFNALRQHCGFGYWSLSAYIKHQVKRATSFVSHFEDVATKYAKGKRCSTVICGHIHTPKIAEVNGVMYCNSGDWVESCTALVEYTDGTLKLLHCPPGWEDDTADLVVGSAEVV